MIRERLKKEAIRFRVAEESELDTVFRMFQCASKHMEEQGIYQWDELYPDRNDLEEDIRKGELYLGVAEQEPVAAYVLNRERDEAYINGKWKGEEASCMVLHRLCVNPAFQGKGIGTFTMRHIEECLGKRGCRSIRLDAFTENPIAERMYKKLGYQVVGFAEFRKGKFFLMEKLL